MSRASPFNTDKKTESCDSVFDIFKQLCKAAVGVDADICALLVDQAVSQQEYLAAQTFCNHVLSYIVSDHQTFLRNQIQRLEDLPVVRRIGLTEMTVIIGGDPSKIRW